MIDLKIGIHQINTITGDIIGNVNKIKEQILKDKNEECDLSIFPETAISGYMCGSLWDRIDFVNEQDSQPSFIDDYIKEISYEGTVVLGCVWMTGFDKNRNIDMNNSAIIMNNKKQWYVYNKQLLANSDHHEDKKYFNAGNDSTTFTINLPKDKKIRIGVLVCEDAWMDDHVRNIPAEMVRNGAQLLIHINQSYFYYGKQNRRIEQFSKVARLCEVPFISVNSCGVGDIVKNIMVFDGGSTIYDESGSLVYEAQQFKEHNEIIKLKNLKPIAKAPTNKFKEITDALIFEQQEFFRLMGIKKAQVHVSGGIDSAVVAALVVKAMGKKNTVLITNPSSLNNKSLDYVEHLSKKLGVNIWENPIQSIFEEFMRIHTQSFDWADLSLTGQSTVQATLRTVQGLAASHQFKSGIVATGNHTEIVLGWASFHDIGSIGVHALIGDLTKIEVFQLAEYINDVLFKSEVIPADLFNGKFKPAAELPDANEDPIDYYIQSGICAMLIRDRMSKEEIMKELERQIPNMDYFPHTNLVKKYSKEELKTQIDFAVESMRTSVYKAAQGAPIVVISPRSRGFSNRETLINKYK